MSAASPSAALAVNPWRSGLQIFLRDLRSYFRTPSGYLIWAISLLIDGLLFNAVAVGEGRRLSTDVLQIYLFNAAFVVEAAAVVLSMRLLAEERATGAQLLLFTSPLGEAPQVLGRFLAAFTLLALITLSSVYLPALIFVHGKVSFGHIAAGYLGMLLVAASTLSIGMFVSALAPRPFVAVLGTAALVGSMELCYFVGRITEGSGASFVSALAPVWQHYQSFRRGLLDAGDLAFFLTLTYLGLLASMRVLAGARRR